MQTPSIQKSPMPLELAHDYSQAAQLKLSLGQSQVIFNAITLLPNHLIVSGSYDKYIRIYDSENGNCLRAWEAHKKEISALATLNNNQFVSGSYDGALKVWDANNGNCIREWQAHDKEISAITVLNDDKLVSASYDGTIKLWDTQTGQILQKIATFDDAITALAIVNNHRVAGGSLHGVIYIFDLEKNACVLTLNAHKAKITSLAPYLGNQLISGSLDSTIKVWDAYFGRCLRILSENQTWVIALKILDEKHLATGLQDSSIKIWNIEKGQCLYTLSGHQHIVLGLNQTQEGQLVSCSADGTIKLWQFPIIPTLEKQHTIPLLPLPQLAPYQEPASMERFTSSVTSPTISEREPHSLATVKEISPPLTPVAVQLSSPSLKPLNPRHEKAQHYFEQGNISKALKIYRKLAAQNDALAIHKIAQIEEFLQVIKKPSDIEALATSQHNVISAMTQSSPTEGVEKISQKQSTNFISEPFVTPSPLWLQTNDEILALAVLNNSILVSGSPYAIQLWDILKKNCLLTLVDKQGVNCLMVSPAGRIVTGSNNGIKLWDWKKGRCIGIFSGHDKPVLALAGLHKGILASGSEDHKIKIWQPGRKINPFIKDLIGHTNWVTCLATLMNGFLLSGSMDCTLKIWNPENGECLQTFTEHESYIFALAVFPDNRFASGSNDNTIKLWHPDKKQSLLTLKGHTGCVQALQVFSKNVLASASYDNTIKLWDVNSGQCLKTIPAHKNPIRALTLLQDRQHLVSGSLDATIRSWQISFLDAAQQLSAINQSITRTPVEKAIMRPLPAQNDINQQETITPLSPPRISDLMGRYRSNLTTDANVKNKNKELEKDRDEESNESKPKMKMPSS